MVNIKPTEFSLIALYEEGRQVVQDRHKDAEAGKLGTLRGGSAGCITSGGEILGSSPWKTLARYLGFQLPVNNKSLDVFDGGFANEAMWDKYLTERGTNFTGEEKYPLTYTVVNVPCTGRPDVIILERGTNVPVLGGEYKGVMSLGTAKDVYCGNKPKDDNFIQSCHYSYKFGLPWILVYQSFSIFPADYWAKKQYGVEEIPPFRREFKIGCEAGKFYYITEDGTRVDTLVTTTGIDEYYQAIVESAQQKNISWMRMAPHDIHGNIRPYDLNIYDEFCCLVSPNTGFDNWVKQVERACKQSRVIKPKTVSKKLKYRVMEEGTIVEEFDTIEEAREFIFGGNNEP